MKSPPTAVPPVCTRISPQVEAVGLSYSNYPDYAYIIIVPNRDSVL